MTAIQDLTLAEEIRATEAAHLDHAELMDSNAAQHDRAARPNPAADCRRWAERSRLRAANARRGLMLLGPEELADPAFLAAFGNLAGRARQAGKATRRPY